jgi:hypothetical protein
MKLLEKVLNWVFDPMNVMVAFGGLMLIFSHITEDPLDSVVMSIASFFIGVVTLSTCAIINAINEKKEK